MFDPAQVIEHGVDLVVVENAFLLVARLQFADVLLKGAYLAFVVRVCLFFDRQHQRVEFALELFELLLHFHCYLLYTQKMAESFALWLDFGCPVITILDVTPLSRKTRPLAQRAFQNADLCGYSAGTVQPTCGLRQKTPEEQADQGRGGARSNVRVFQDGDLPLPGRGAR